MIWLQCIYYFGSGHAN